MKKKLKNHDKIKKRKNFLPTLFLAILFWITWGWLTYSFPPEGFLVFVGFLTSLFMALFLTASLLLANSRRGFLIAVGLVGFLLFAYFDLGHWLNLALFVAILVFLEIYLAKR